MRNRNIQMFFDAFNGVVIAWHEERNFRIHVVAALSTILAAVFFHITVIECLVVILAIAIVITAELFNTALEELCDKFQPDHDPHIGKIKDLSAAAVFASMIGALAIGLIVFIPHVIALFS